MGVENLLNNKINIKDVQFESVEIQPIPNTESYRQYVALKQTWLFDKERQQWNWFIAEDQELGSTSRNTSDQLLGVFVEAQYDKKNAKKQLDALKGSVLYEDQKKLWNQSMNEDQKLNDRPLTDDPFPYQTSDQLLGILAEMTFDKGLATVRFNELKQSDVYDSQRKLWVDKQYEERKREHPTYGATVQLLGILVESQFDKKAAKEQYGRLKQTALYDSDNNRWNWSMNRDNVLNEPERASSDQLLGILVESLFDREAALNQYEKLKQTVYYDSDRKQWNNEMVNELSQDITKDRDSGNQLLGILTERMSEGKGLFELPEFAIQKDPLPTVRRF